MQQENNWFSIVKLKSVWDFNKVSLNRIINFIWNAYQKDANNTDTFYKNNYYTIDEIKEAIERFDKALKNKEIKPHNNVGFTYEDNSPSTSTRRTNFKHTFSEEVFADAKTLILYDLSIFTDRINKTYRTVDISNIEGKMNRDEFKKYIYKNKIDSEGHSEMLVFIKQLVKILSKRNLSQPDTITDSQNDFLSHIYLSELKKWLVKEN